MEIKVDPNTSLEEITRLAYDKLGFNPNRSITPIKSDGKSPYTSASNNWDNKWDSKILKQMVDDPNQPSLEEVAKEESINKYLEYECEGKWEKHFGTYDSIVWVDGVTPPSEDEFISKTKLYYDEYIFNANKKLKELDRKYPSIKDQLDMMYWDKVNGTNTWVDTITNIKKDNPL